MCVCHDTCMYVVHAHALMLTLQTPPPNLRLALCAYCTCIWATYITCTRHVHVMRITDSIYWVSYVNFSVYPNIWNIFGHPRLGPNNVWRKLHTLFWPAYRYLPKEVSLSPRGIAYAIQGGYPPWPPRTSCFFFFFFLCRSLKLSPTT